MSGLLATNGTMPSSSYAKALRPPIQTSTTTRPMRVTVMPGRSRRAASSNSLLIQPIDEFSLCQGARAGISAAGRDLTQPVAEDVRLDPAGDERDLRPLVPRDLRRCMQGDRVPHHPDVRLVNAVGAEEVPGRVRAINLEAVVGASVLRGKPEV